MRVLILAFFLLFAFVAPLAAAEEDYICPMHPHIHGKQGDHCPICGMELVPAKGPEKKSEAGEVEISPAYTQALGVRTAKAEYHDFGKSIHSYGRIVPSTRGEYRISLRKSGWIRDLNASAVGDAVKKGDVLFTFYSPDLIAIETEYLTGLRTSYKPAATEQRLRLYGMDGESIELLKKKGEVIEDVPFHAPADGVVSALEVRRGAFVEDGGPVMAIQDYSTVWVEAHVPLKDLPSLAIGTPAAIRVTQTGQEGRSAISYIYPAADPDTREAMVRIELDNPDGRFRTDVPVDVMFEAESRKRLAVPEEAVLYGGMGAWVVKSLGGGRFRPVMISTGVTSRGMTEVTSGLSEGDAVVISGQFMIDAESSLSGGMAAMEHDHGH